jgi:C4-dicarboxylate transporter, DctM subunit
MLKLIDTLSDWCGRLAAWLFFLIGIIIVFEVIARYVFLAPTIWSEEMSRFLQIWATYLAAAHVLRNRQLIAIDLVVRSLSPLLRTCCEALALLVIIAFSLVAVVYGTEIVVDSLRVGRSTATIATVAIPEMISRGYSRPFVLGLLAAGGTLGILIPPSIPLILYGVITEESIVSLFMAGVGPGLLLTALFILFSIGYSLFDKNYRPSPKTGWPERWRASFRALPTLFLAVVVIGGIYLGVFTPTESAGIGFALSLLIVFLLRTMTWEKLKQAVMESMATTVTIFLIIAGAKLFGKAITIYQIPQQVSSAITANIGEPALFILVVCLVLLLIGFFLESISMLLIMVPVLYPALMAMGIDPIWFGILFVVMIEIALITPPVGMNLFIIQAVAQVDLGEVLKGVWPFLLIMFGTVIAISVLPDIVLYIPFKL